MDVGGSRAVSMIFMVFATKYKSRKNLETSVKFVYCDTHLSWNKNETFFFLGSSNKSRRWLIRYIVLLYNWYFFDFYN